jgi:hypothetical protein
MALQELRASSASSRPPRVRSLYLCVTARSVVWHPSLIPVSRWAIPHLSRLGLFRPSIPLIFFRGASTEGIVQVCA